MEASTKFSLPDLGQAMTLGRLIRPFDHWRLFSDLKGSARFIDIETEGLALSDPITMVGVSDGFSTHVLVSGRDLTRQRLAEELAGARLLVTFNGASFDLPRLRQAFPSLPWHLPHLDLALMGRRVGLCGGLKAIQRAVGYRRPPDLRDITGAGAVKLWNAHLSGDPIALATLIRYNRTDTESLVGLADLIVERLTQHDGEEGWIPRLNGNAACADGSYFGQQLRNPPTRAVPRLRLASA